MSSPCRALVAADVGPGIGLGHLNRSLALAAAIIHRGGWAGVVTSQSGPLRARVTAAELPVVAAEDWPRWDENGIAQLSDLARIHRAETVVVDSYRIGATGLGRLRQAGLSIVFIDDLAREAFPCQVVVNPSPAARKMPYRSLHGDTRFLLGPQYALLRPAFWERGDRKLRDRPEAILLSTGATDPGTLIPELIFMLDTVSHEFSVEVLVGPFADPGPVSEAARHCRRAVRLHHDPSYLRDLLLHADVAVAAAGQTLYELAWAGCPTVAFEMAPNQAVNLRTMAGCGTVLAAGSAGSPDFLTWVRPCVERLLGEDKLRRRMSDAGRWLVDGRGALRVAAEMES